VWVGIRRAIASDADREQERRKAVEPGAKGDCGGALGNERVSEQFVTDIPPVDPYTTQFNVHVGDCTCCGRRVQGRDPRQVSDALGAASCQIGATALGMAAYLNKSSGMTYGKISSFFTSAFNLSVSRAALARALERLAKKAKPLYEHIVSVIRNSTAVYPDETGWRINAAKAWLWVFVSLERQATVYVIRRSRGFEVAEEILGEDFAGLLGRDGWIVYNRFELAVHQLCTAHLLRRCESLLETLPSRQAVFAFGLKLLLLDALHLRNRRREEAISEHGFRVALGKLEARLGRLLETSYSHPEIEKFANHIAYYRNDLFTFLRHPEVEATNWPAEQAIRPGVVNRKISCGNRSDVGAETQAILMTVLRTSCQRGLEPIEVFSDLLHTPDPAEYSRLALGP
jgi:transposase